MERLSTEKFSGDEVLHTACSLLEILKNRAAHFISQKTLKLKVFSHKIFGSKLPGRVRPEHPIALRYERERVCVHVCMYVCVCVCVCERERVREREKKREEERVEWESPPP